MEERLQKLMARAGLGSRRDNERLIAAGRVRLNGRVARLGDKADPLVDQIEVDGKPLSFTDQGKIYVKLHKPRGVISSLADELEADRPVIRELVPLAGHIYPVGRLDKQSEGLILMTNDGELAHRLTHPSFEHKKVYEVVLEGEISKQDLDRWRAGVELDEQKTVPATIEIIRQSADETELRITLREGRKRQIRRIAATFGHPVRRLVRTKIGPLELGDLQPGEWRHLTADELQQLRNTVQSPAQRKNKPKHRTK